MNAANFFVVAVILLTAPPETMDSIPEPWEQISLATQELAIKWEIMDVREKNYILKNKNDFQSDIKTLRVRYADFKDSPRIWECNRLPPRQLCNQMCNFNRRYRRHLEERLELELDRRFILDEAIGETEDLFRVWDMARDAQCEYYYITQRRQALKKLKAMLGDEDYANMRLPPNVPFWRFNEMK